MESKDREFLKRLKATFRAEAEEHVQAISSGLIELEKSAAPERRAALMEAVFRESHSLKGAARAVNLKDVESICQSLESAFSALQHGSIAASRGLFDLLHKSVDAIGGIVSSPDMEGSAKGGEAAGNLMRRLGEASTVPVAAAEPGPASAPEGAAEPPRPFRAEPDPAAGTVRISMEKLDSLLLKAEEMIAIKIAADHRVSESREILRALQEGKIESMRRKEREIAAGPRRKERPDQDEAFLNSLDDRLTAGIRALERDRRSIARMVDENLEEMKKAVMLPVSTLTETFPKIIRDLARDTGKEAEGEVLGGGIEIDKRILEEMKDPMIHLLRNSVGHGIEAPEERAALGKSARGAITIAFALKDGRQVEISVSDDGAGIDPDSIRAAAVKAGIVQPENGEMAEPEEGLALIFRSGVSTSRIITDVSGRGLGLAIVREKVEKLGGSVTVETRKNSGTTFRILLPMTLSTFRGVTVRAGEGIFVLPMISAERALRVKAEGIRTVENSEVIRLNGRIIPLIRLADALELPQRERPERSEGGNPGFPGEYFSIVVLRSMDKRIAFQVDEIIGEQQVTVKGLGSQLKRVRNVVGAAIFGNGRIVPVLSVPDLMKSAALASSRVKSAIGEVREPTREQRVLVAEDSITARMLLKNILESAGYSVTTAIDGTDAFVKALAGDFDIVVSDVDMPLMSGFELTAKIRGDARLSALPVILVTALESREDRERGIETGANAYIVKSGFDQGVLLETIARLL